ncbi:hypothetical protein NIES2119_26335 [[Phormidium ambiguum] IAM M-71]|uniref:Uncharacterized protein n=1 Tax=[Phormidium ambiguum] IAM M-71 TaxID=454136 RepID=A0A1U7I7N3_9CYAN|nr:hypothetical protein [Phormidium ambiguum]OKH32357.1 hypothetical protein NIES2119_26335 [Phormidium ambiguum IAM M-71]
MEDKSIPQHFLDTSVARSLLLGTQAYKQYFQSQFGDQSPNISNYVQMEMKRSYLINLISFYFVLRLETINSIGDAIVLWSNRFKTSELKAILQLIPQLFSTHQLDFTSSSDKEKALSILGIYIKRFELILRKKFTNTNQDSTACTRAQVPLRVELRNMADGLKQFADEFGDVETCRNQCQIDEFLLSRYSTEIEAYIQQASQLPNNKNTRGFIKIANNLKEIREQGASACDCKRCEKIGDVVIALDAPRTMQLEHTDNSFDYLCPPINQPHCKHPSETQIVINKSGDNF